MAFTGALPLEIVVPVLVAEDTIYARERADHTARLLLFGLPQISIGSAPFQLLQLPRPAPALFEDRFAGVLPVLEHVSQKAVVSAPQPFALSYRPSTRLSDPDPEDSTRRFNHGQLFSFLISSVVSSAVYVYAFELPDLCDNPWLEVLRKPTPPDASLYAFRQIYPPSPAHRQRQIFGFISAVDWWLQAESKFWLESFGDFRVRNHGLDLYPFRQRRVVTPPPVLQGPWVEVTEPGYYEGVYRPIGDVFQLNSLADLSDANVNYDGTFSPFSGWMQVIPGNPTTLEQAMSMVVQGRRQVPGVPLPRTIL